MRTITKTQGKIALVDDEDYEGLITNSWCISTKGYAHSRRGYMHRLIMKAPSHFEVDHENGNKLDNQKANLRLCTTALNQRHRPKWAGVTSRYKGVHQTKDGRWIAQITIKSRKVHLGRFSSEHVAAMAYDLWAYDLSGEFAYTNFKRVAGS